MLALPVAASIKVVAIEIWLKHRVREGDDLARKNLREIQRRDNRALKDAADAVRGLMRD